MYINVTSFFSFFTMYIVARKKYFRKRQRNEDCIGIAQLSIVNYCSQQLCITDNDCRIKFNPYLWK